MNKRNWILFLYDRNSGQHLVFRFHLSDQEKAKHCAKVYRGRGWETTLVRSNPIVRHARKHVASLKERR